MHRYIEANCTSCHGTGYTVVGTIDGGKQEHRAVFADCRCTRMVPDPGEARAIIELANQLKR